MKNEGEWAKPTFIYLNVLRQHYYFLSAVSFSFLSLIITTMDFQGLNSYLKILEIIGIVILFVSTFITFHGLLPTLGLFLRIENLRLDDSDGKIDRETNLIMSEAGKLDSTFGTSETLFFLGGFIIFFSRIFHNLLTTF